MTKPENPTYDVGQEVQGNEVYDMNIALIDSLDEMAAQDLRYKRRERFWRNCGPALAVAPFVAAGILAATPAGHRMNTNEKIGIDVYALAGSLFLGAASLHEFDKSKEEGQKLATSAAHISQALNGSLQPWIIRRLDEKEIDRQKRETLRGKS